MVWTTGFEPAVSGSQIRRFTKLSYIQMTKYMQTDQICREICARPQQEFDLILSAYWHRLQDLNPHYKVRSPVFCPLN